MGTVSESNEAVKGGGLLALLSVSDKTGLAPFARRIAALGYDLVSTGGTKTALEGAKVSVNSVTWVTGFPEIMDGRVKTLDPHVHGAILCDWDNPEHVRQAIVNKVRRIEIVVVNLYPFEKTIADPDVAFEVAIENIDIGGPAMVRAAAKNHKHVVIVTDPTDYERVADALESGGVSPAMRRELARKAFEHTARYDALISDWLLRQTEADPFSAELTIGLKRVQTTRYGENPHQRGAFYADGNQTGRSLARVRVHQGKELSFNNIADLDAAVRAVFDHENPAAAIIKHMNPCGLATATDIQTAYGRALACDPVSAYGGILAFNRLVTGFDAQVVRQSNVFYEVIVAPGFDPQALDAFRSKENLRVIELPEEWASLPRTGMDARRVQGGWLLQDWDADVLFDWDKGLVTKRKPTDDEKRALHFAWRGCAHVKSNAIVLARALPDGEVLNGIGAGQMNRVGSVRIAIENAKLPVPGSVLAGDAFFPFPDGPEIAIKAGVTAMIHPGGSIRDKAVIDLADEHDVAMVFTGIRHFRH